MNLRPVLTTFFGFTLLFFAMSAGYVDTVDAEPSIETARALIASGSLETHPDKAYLIAYARAAGDDPKRGWYSKLGLGMPILYVPAIILGRKLHSLTGWSSDLCERFFVAEVNVVLAALLLTCFFIYWGASEKYPRKFVLPLFALGFATLILPYSKTCHREIALAFFLSTAFIATNQSRFLIAGVSIASVFLIKNMAGFALLPVIVLCLSRTENIRQRLKTIGPLCAALAIQLYFQAVAFGSLWNTGYSPGITHFETSQWSTPLWQGIWQQLFSSDYGLLFYSPILILVAVAALKVGDENTGFRKAVWATIGMLVLLHARWKDPSGGDALGPRYLVPAIPLFFLLFSDPKKIFSWIPSPSIAIALVLLALSQQIVNTAVKAQQYGSMQARASEPLSPPHWQANLQLFAHKLEKKEEVYSEAEINGQTASLSREIDLSDAPTLSGFNFWWSHIRKPAFASLANPNQNPVP